MKKDLIKRISAVISAVAVVTGGVSAGTYFGNYNTANMWKDVFYSEMTRLYGGNQLTFGYTYSAWPGAKSDHHNGIMAALSYQNTWDVAQVFGEDCQDLLFSDIKSTQNYKDYFKDSGRLLEPQDIYEWDGFLFAVVSGHKPDIVTETVTFTYGSLETVTEDVATRSATGTNGKTGKDSYLYVYDISEGKNYGEALVAKWHINDILGGEQNAFAIFESVAVNDDYICLMMNNGEVSGDKAEYSYDRSLIILENNIKRGGENIFPVRADDIDDTYRYGGKVISEASVKSDIKNITGYDSAIIGDHYIMFHQSPVDMVKANDKTIIGEEKIIIADLRDVKRTGTVNKRSLVISDMYDENEERTLSVSIDELLPVSGKSWYDIESAKLRGIKIDGTHITFLVTYTESANGKTTYYKHLFVTDWSNPQSPKYVTDFKYVDVKNTDSAGVFGVSDDIFYYEGYYYITNTYGVDVIKKYDESGMINLSYVTTHLYSESTWGMEGQMDVYVTGNYLVAWRNYNYNTGFETRLRLSDDKSEIVEFCGFGKRNRYRTLNDGNDIITYKDRVYLMSNGNLYATMQPCINVLDLKRAAPMSVRINNMPSEVSVPYTISGSVTGADKVAVYVDGELLSYVDAVKMQDGTRKWEYTVTESGSHSISAVAVPFGEYIIEETKDTVSYCGISAEEVNFSGSYSESGDKLKVSVSVMNSGEVAVSGKLVVGIYKNDTLYSLGISDKITIEAGKTTTVDDFNVDFPTFLSGYTVKAFLTEGNEGFMPLTSAKELTIE